MLPRKKQQAIFERALKVIPYGVSSNFRYGGHNSTNILSRGKGAKVWDADGNEFIDYRLAWGPHILGHADERVNNAVRNAIDNSTMFAATTELEVEVAEKMVEMIPEMDLIRFTNTGTEATMHALRVARGYTNKEKYIKFEGHYHGLHDYALFSTANTPSLHMGSRRSPIPIQVGSGIPRKIRDYVITLPWNDFEIVEQTIKSKHGEIAAVMVEPIIGNFGGLYPIDGFLEHLRKLCDEYGIVLIFDEVKTGFRIANGGAREVFNVIPDISTYAKALGNGYPVAAFGGKRDVMQVVGPGRVAHGGTYGSNTIAMAAAKTVLGILADDQTLDKIAKQGKRLKKGIEKVFRDYDIPYQMTGHPNMQGFFITEKPINEFRDFELHNAKMYGDIMKNLFERGVTAELEAVEPWFLSASHTAEIIDETLNRFEDSVKALINK
jgi:glutamate-1-semialdehyde 2,1-aminomutase